MSEEKRVDELSLAEAEEALENTRRLRDEKAVAHDFDAAEHCGHVMSLLVSHIDSKQPASKR